MGVLNVTPDSFFDGGKYFKKDDADTRLKHVYLSEKGLNIFNEIFTVQKKRIYKALIDSDSKEVIYFNKVLDKLINE